MTRRALRLASTLRQEVQALLARGLSDPRVRGLVTVTDVRVADDLRTAKILVSVRPVESADLTLHGLRSAAGHIRRLVGERLALRTLPALHFEHDQGPARQAGVIDALARAAAEFSHGPAPDAPTAKDDPA
jgi:ribosome-binding factor A